MATVLLSGGSGFLGRHLITSFICNGHEVHNIGRMPSDKTTNNHILDLANFDAIRRVIKNIQPEYLFHLAGDASQQTLAGAMAVNTIFGDNVLRALEAETTAALFVGSAAEYGIIDKSQLPIKESMLTMPYSHYGISKLAATLYAINWQNERRKLVVVRPFSLLGAGERSYLAIGNFVNQIRAREATECRLETGNLNVPRDFVDVDDAVDLLWKLINCEQSYEQVINLCSGNPVCIGEMLKYLSERVEKKVSTHQVNRLMRPVDMPIHYGNNDKLQNLLGELQLTSWQASLDNIIRIEKLGSGDTWRTN